MYNRLSDTLIIYPLHHQHFVEIDGIVIFFFGNNDHSLASQWVAGMLGQMSSSHSHVNVSYARGLNTPFQTLGLPAARGNVDFRLIPRLSIV